MARYNPRNSLSSYSSSSSLSSSYSSSSSSSFVSNHARRPIEWQVGDIAYLKNAAGFGYQDYEDLIQSKYLQPKATNHPVIVLATANGKAIIIPISAYSSDYDNHYLAPWKQTCHKFKKESDFYFFQGSEAPRNAQGPGLTLMNGCQMPKPKTSWVYLQAVRTVPHSVLGVFNKSPTQLRLTEASHMTIKALINTHSTTLAEAKARFGIVEQAQAAADTPSRAITAKVPVVLLATPLKTEIIPAVTVASPPAKAVAVAATKKQTLVIAGPSPSSSLAASPSPSLSAIKNVAPTVTKGKISKRKSWNPVSLAQTGTISCCA